MINSLKLVTIDSKASNVRLKKKYPMLCFPVNN